MGYGAESNEQREILELHTDKLHMALEDGGDISGGDISGAACQDYHQ
jgi:hypothetical protein